MSASLESFLHLSSLTHILPADMPVWHCSELSECEESRTAESHGLLTQQFLVSGVLGWSLITITFFMQRLHKVPPSAVTGYPAAVTAPASQAPEQQNKKCAQLNGDQVAIRVPPPNPEGEFDDHFLWLVCLLAGV